MFYFCSDIQIQYEVDSTKNKTVGQVLRSIWDKVPVPLSSSKGLLRYTDLLDIRSPEFASADAQRKIYLLKESLVEDYRIWLNSMAKNGKFILPNINTFQGDFLDPTLLQEGVAIMKEMFRGDIGNRQVERSNVSKEPNRHIRAAEIHSKAVRDNWYPGKNRMTEQDHLDVIAELEKEEKRQALQSV